MFGRSMFDDDPFFADHRNMMDSMMRGFGGFGGGFGAIEGGRGGERRDAERRRDRPMDPFQQMHQQMNSMMQNFGRGQGMFDARMPDMGGRGGDDGHSFSHSSVYTYTSDGQGPPKIFQASTEERRAPGAIRETKKAVRDSESGMQKMAVGHHLGDRGHVIERAQNMRTGQQEENQNFIGLTENDGATFNEEWTRATGGGNAGGPRKIEGHRGRGNDGHHGHRGTDGYQRRGEGHRERREQRALPEGAQPRNPRDQMLK